MKEKVSNEQQEEKVVMKPFFKWLRAGCLVLVTLVVLGLLAYQLGKGGQKSPSSRPSHQMAPTFNLK